MKVRSSWFLAASFVGWPLTIAVALSVPAVITKLLWGINIPVAWFVSLLAMFGLPSPVGLGISGMALCLAVAGLVAEAKSSSRVRRAILIIFCGIALVCLTYGLWFNLTRQGDTMF